VESRMSTPVVFNLGGRFCTYGLEMLRISGLKYSRVIADTFIFEFDEITMN
jgi:hypothetical protein